MQSKFISRQSGVSGTCPDWLGWAPSCLWPSQHQVAKMTEWVGECIMDGCFRISLVLLADYLQMNTGGQNNINLSNASIFHRLNVMRTVNPDNQCFPTWCLILVLYWQVTALPEFISCTGLLSPGSLHLTISYTKTCFKVDLVFLMVLISVCLTCLHILK